MWNSLRTLGALCIALVVGVSSSLAGELTNVTVGRDQDFTVVTLHGEGPMTVTHQIVEAKDGKPHRIVVDVMGAVHKLPQNNFQELPAGSITTIRTSQFAVSPDPVVRVVLDLAHPAAYKLETPENEVRIMVSLPGDPPMERVWSAREGGWQQGPAQSQPTYAQAETAAPAEADAAAATSGAQATAGEVAAGEAGQAQAEPSTNAPAEAAPAEAAPNAEATAESQAAPATGAATEEHAAPAETAPQQVEPNSDHSAPGWNNPAKAAEPAAPAKGLPLAPTGAVAYSAGSQTPESADASTEHAEGAEPQSTNETTASDASASNEGATHSPEAAAAATAGAATVHESSTEAYASSQHAEEAKSAPAAHETAAPELPMPEQAIPQPERVIDYNLPVPAAMAQSQAAEAEAEPRAPAQETAPGEPKLALTEPKAAPSTDATAEESAGSAAPTGTDAQATDVGSQPMASLSTLPPLSESAADLVPERTQILYHTQGRRDPFKPLLQAGGYNAAALPDVASLRLVGVLHDVKESWGLFEDANGYGYILRKGDRVKNGSLTQLTNNRAYFSLTEFGWSRSVHLDLEPEG